MAKRTPRKLKKCRGFQCASLCKTCKRYDKKEKEPLNESMVASESGDHFCNHYVHYKNI